MQATIQALFPNLNLASPIKVARQETVDYVAECLGLATDFQSSLVVIPATSCTVLEDMPYDQAWKLAAEGFKKCADYAEEAGVTLAMEYISSPVNNFITNVDSMLKMVNEVGSKSLGAMIDIAHSRISGEDPSESARRAGRDLVHVHLADSDRLPLGKGSIDILSFLRTLKEISYKGGLAVELWGANPETLARESMAFLKRVPADLLPE